MTLVFGWRDVGDGALVDFLFVNLQDCPISDQVTKDKAVGCNSSCNSDLKNIKMKSILRNPEAQILFIKK